MKKILFGLATLATLALPAVAEDRYRGADRFRDDHVRAVRRVDRDEFRRFDRDRFYRREFDRDHRVVIVRRDGCR